MTPKPRAGIYAWAGPGTVRLLETKYFRPKIDKNSFLGAYDLPYLSKLKELFGVTDAFVSYSWGFSDITEQEDYAFLRSKLKHFKKLEIRTQAYVQGLNLVTREFHSVDPWCKDPWGRCVPYSPGRSFICPNNPIARDLLKGRVARATKEPVDGVYIDNILFGLPPFILSSNILPFFGCSCSFCQREFQAMFGYTLPLKEKMGQEIKDYLQFRAESIRKLIHGLAAIVHHAKKEFGINLYDPTLRSDTLYYGYSLDTIEPYLDYILIENHSLPSQPGVNNQHLKPLLSIATKPVFVVSYKQGIGSEPQYTQSDIDLLFTESKALGYAPCLKVTEFTTNDLWHMLRLDSLSAPRLKRTPSFPSARLQPLSKSKMWSPVIVRFQKWITALLYIAISHPRLSSSLSRRRFYKQILTHPRLYGI